MEPTTTHSFNILRTADRATKLAKYNDMSPDNLKGKINALRDIIAMDVFVEGGTTPGVLKHSRSGSKYWTKKYVQEKFNLRLESLTTKIGERSAALFLKEFCNNDIDKFNRLETWAHTDFAEDPYLTNKTVVEAYTKDASSLDPARKRDLYRAQYDSMDNSQLIIKFAKLEFDSRRPDFLKIPKNPTHQAKIWTNDYMRQKYEIAKEILTEKIGAENVQVLLDGIDSISRVHPSLLARALRLATMDSVVIPIAIATIVFHVVSRRYDTTPFAVISSALEHLTPDNPLYILRMLMAGILFYVLFNGFQNYVNDIIRRHNPPNQ